MIYKDMIPGSHVRSKSGKRLFIFVLCSKIANLEFATFPVYIGNWTACDVCILKLFLREIDLLRLFVSTCQK